MTIDVEFTIPQAYHLITQAKSDDIKVSVTRIHDSFYLTVGRSDYRTFHSALHHIQFLQSQIVEPEARP